MKEKPFAPSCERNKGPILEQLKRIFGARKLNILEIGSGTGQHAVHFAEHLPDVTWTTSDCEINHAGIKEWLSEAKNSRIKGPLTLEFGVDSFPSEKFDVVYSANTLHIMPWKSAKTMMKFLGKNLAPKSIVLFYGPFNRLGKFTSPGNEELDKLIKGRNPQSGLRNFEDVVNNMAKNGLFLIDEIQMPANNHLLYFERN